MSSAKVARSMSQDSISGSRNATQCSRDRWKMSVSRNSRTMTRISSKLRPLRSATMRSQYSLPSSSLATACEHVQQPLGDEPLELAEGLRLEDRADLPLPCRGGTCGGSTRGLPETGVRALPPAPASAPPSAGPPPTAPAPRSAASGTGPSCHRCRCGSERGAPSSGSGAGRCRTRSPARRGRARAAPGRIPPTAAGSRTTHPSGCLPGMIR